MVLSKNAEKKIHKKIKRCQQLLAREVDLKFSEAPTECIVICNAGLSTGLQQEVLLGEILQHGTTPPTVEDVVFPAGKSYCYLRFGSTEEAKTVYEGMNGIATLGQDGCVLLMAYCVGLPAEGALSEEDGLPPGLILIPAFVDEGFEAELLGAVDWAEEEEMNGSLKHRKVKHFGYEFLYGTNNVDRNKPLQRKIPSVCEKLWVKLKELHPELGWHVPEQMTVNRYEPGQGIPPHVDTHSAFQDPIVSLSLGSAIVMDFRNPEGRHLNVDLPRRSLLVMTGESRLGWTHGVTPRKMDTLRLNNSLSIRKRELRVSFTFRKLNDGPCRCQFSSLCDTYQQEARDKTDRIKENAAQLELENVHKVYNEIAKHFSETRHSPWPRISAFLESLQPGSVLLDIGCGNGKYLNLNPNLIALGCDRSDGLLKVCTERGFRVVQCDCLALPFRSECADACICIAVIHHLASLERRRQSIQEMARVLRPGGRALIYVWAKNQEANAKKSSYLRQNKQNNKPSEESTRSEKSVPIEHRVVVGGEGNASLPVHTNRTQFQHQDLLVPWKLRDVEQRQQENETKVTFLRYYHVFEETELAGLCREIAGISVEDSYYDQGNWCVIFRKD
ncbi:alkylated DNA repair protein alkB homolog 8 [Aedes albopictus]|uniref:Fe2OG dioxygenase domain-containing protein n=1 Tax=Aedes albopictus TaxID=7160 RepID=A0ABM1XQU9_AEDAL|nr:alkylated DNA repair protein alkB homolog 8 [Aedes albopictus]